MKILLIVCHPRAESFNHALCRRAEVVLQGLGHAVVVHDLYAKGFDPVLSASELGRGFSFNPTVQLHSRELRESAGLVVFHPDWWGQPPAILKGWLDRVLRPGIAYEFVGQEFLEKDKIPLLVGKKGLVFCTSDSRQHGGHQVLSTLWKDTIFGYCGMSAEYHVFHDAFHSERSRRQEWMAFMEKELVEWFPPDDASMRRPQPVTEQGAVGGADPISSPH